MNRQSKLVIASAAAFTIIGCNVGPNYHKPKDHAPAAFRESKTTDFPTTQSSTTQPTADPRRWWTTFHDPQLDSLIERAVKANLDLAAAEARVREARANYGFVAADEYPTADANASATRSRASKSGTVGITGSSTSTGGTSSGGTGSTTTGGTTTGGSTSSSAIVSNKTERASFQAGFDAAWEIDVFGGVRRASEAAAANVEATIADRDDILITLLSEVANNYVQLRGFQRQIEIAQNNIKSQRDTLDLTRARFNAGLASDLDVARAEAQVATTESAIPSLANSVQANIYAIGVLLGQNPEPLADELSAPHPIPYSFSTIPVGLPSDLLRRRPDVRRTERQLAAATANIGAAQADYFPRFSLTGTFGTSASRIKDLGNSSSIFYSFGPSVSWPIFDANRIKFNVEIQNQRQKEALAAYRKAVLTALSDIETSLIRYNQEQAHHEALQRAVNANRRAVDLSTQLYNKGLAAFLDVLTAQRDLFVVEDQLVQSDAFLSSDLIAVYKALGGGWELANPVSKGGGPKSNLGIGP